MLGVVFLGKIVLLIFFFGSGRMPGSSSKFGNLEFSNIIVKLKNSTCNIKIWLYKSKIKNKFKKLLI